jgi:UTP--glucose-1-phosphate uridylyltransferase
LIHDEPVAVLLADDLILGSSCLAEMVASYQGGNMVAVMDVPESETGSYGIITPGADHGQLIEVSGLVEKPEPANAPSNIGVVGRYIIESGVFAQLGTQDRGAGNEVQLTDALARQIGKVPFHGFRFSGERFDCGSKIGFLQANIAFAMSRDDLAEPLASWIKNRMVIS